MKRIEFFKQYKKLFYIENKPELSAISNIIDMLDGSSGIELACVSSASLSEPR